MVHRKTKGGGFTLIELMVTVAIIAILARIAYPSYVTHVQKGARRSAQAQMLDLATREQQYLIANRGYASYSTLVTAGYSFPSELSTKYSTPTITCTPSCDAAATTAMPTFTIKFTPIGSQASDPPGYLTLTSEGVKYCEHCSSATDVQKYW